MDANQMVLSCANKDRQIVWPPLETVFGILICVLSVSISLFHLYTAQFGSLMAYKQRVIHLYTLMTLGFIVYPTLTCIKTTATRCLDLVIALVPLGIQIYMLLNFERMAYREFYMDPMTTADIAMAVATILLLLEVSRRVVGLALPIIACFFIVYTFVGSYLPYPFTIKSPPVLIFLDHMFMTPHAIFGTPTGVSATYVFIFIIFGSFLAFTGGSRTIIDISLALVGKSTGAPAKVAIVASGFFGSISGSAVANVYGTGTFTIPMMKKAGYRPEFAGAVEATASAGGQIMPPVMGAAAFIMAELLGVPYLEVCKAALIPALLYYIALFAAVHFEALRTGMVGLKAEDLPNLKAAFSAGWPFFLPIIVLVGFLVMGFTAFTAALYSVYALVAINMLRKSTRMKSIDFLNCFVDAGKNGIQIAICCGCAGIIVGVLDVTGLGMAVIGMLMEFSGGYLFLQLVLVLLACLVLGMGIPTAPAYIIAALAACPALIQMGVEPMAAHMFVLYGAILSAITPPVALAAFAGAAIAKANAVKTAVLACRIGFLEYLLPFVIVYNQLFLMQGKPLHIIWAFCTAVCGIICMVVGFTGFFKTPLPIYRRFIWGIAGLLMFIPEGYTDMIGLSVAVCLAFYEKKWLKLRQYSNASIR